MKNSIRVMAICSLLSFSMIATAKPAKCPSVHTIIAAGFSEVIKAEGQWGAIQHSFYDTNVQWQFALVPIKGKSEKERMENALKLLKSLQFVYGPIADMDDTGWCQYSIPHHKIMAVAKYGEEN